MESYGYPLWRVPPRVRRAGPALWVWGARVHGPCGVGVHVTKRGVWVGTGERGELCTCTGVVTRLFLFLDLIEMFRPCSCEFSSERERRVTQLDVGVSQPTGVLNLGSST